MPSDAAMMVTESAADAGVKPGGKVRLLTLADLDGRTTAKREIESRVALIETDLGGVDQLSTLQRDLVEGVAILGVMLNDRAVRWLNGQPIDPVTYCTMINTHRRTAEAIGVGLVQKGTPDLSTYLAGKAARPPSAPRLVAPTAGGDATATEASAPVSESPNASEDK